MAANSSQGFGPGQPASAQHTQTRAGVRGKYDEAEQGVCLWLFIPARVYWMGFLPRFIERRSLLLGGMAPLVRDSRHAFPQWAYRKLHSHRP